MSSAPPIHFGLDVVIPRIIEIGMAHLPKEACGVVIPNLDMAPDDWVHELTNRSSNPLNSYEIDSHTIDALVANPDAWADVLVWHTHPSGSVGPSKGDVESKIDGLRYLVVALPRGEAVLF